MKICKHCQAENADELLQCAACGAALETDEAETAETVEDVVETTEEPAVSDDAATENAAEPEKKKSHTGLIIGLVVAVLVVVGIIFGKSQYDRNKAEEAAAAQAAAEAEAAAQEEAVPTVVGAHHVNAYGYNSHCIHYTDNGDGTYTYDYLDADGNSVSVSAEEVEALLDQQVAECGGRILTNREIIYYYDEQLYAFSSSYSSYLSFLMDTSKALDEQMGMDGVSTWEQTFVAAAIDMFHKMSAVNAQAEEAGHALTEAEQAQVETMRSDLEAEAAAYGYANADAYLKAYFGPVASIDSYMDFYKLNLYTNSYMNNLQASFVITDEDLNNYYDENADWLLGSYGIDKVDKNVVHVRHILIQPESTTAEDGTTTITDEAWAAAEEEAQRIYDEWLAGEATEDTFAELATTYTQDPGSSATGGLYEDIYPGQMVTEFNDWCFSDGRQVGDHGIVKTSYGYHIMFFSGEGDYVYWKMAVEDMLLSDKVSDEIANAQAKYVLTSDQTKVVMLEDLAPTVPVMEAE